MLPSVDGMVTSPYSRENSLQAQISNSLCFLYKESVQEENFTELVRCFPVEGQLSLFFSETSEAVLIYLIKYKRREAILQNIRECRIVVYSMTDLAIRYENYITTCIPGCMPSRNTLIDSI